MTKSAKATRYYVAPNLPITGQIEIIPISHLIDVRFERNDRRAGVCTLDPIPLVMKRADGYLPLDRPRYLETELARHPRARQLLVIVVSEGPENPATSLIRRVRQFTIEKPYLGHKAPERLAHWLLRDNTKDFLQALSKDARETVNGVQVAVNELEGYERFSRTTAYRALKHVWDAHGRSRKCPRRSRKALYKAQSKLNLPDDDDPEGVPA